MTKLYDRGAKMWDGISAEFEGRPTWGRTRLACGTSGAHCWRKKGPSAQAPHASRVRPQGWGPTWRAGF
jgi:hypothetical protein